MAFSFQVTSNGSTCTFMGEDFLAGETLTGFETRCGSFDDFPCVCDPSQSPPISCPYCSFALPNEGLLCLFDGDTETFTDIDNALQTCTCSVDKEHGPVTNCDARPGLTVSQTTTTIEQSSSSDSCTLDLADGESRVFARGESLGEFLPNRCGDDFPCYCNPDAPNSIECPYCRFPAQDGELLCAGDGEDVSFVDLNGQEQFCSCEVPSDPSIEPTSKCDSGESSKGDEYNGGGESTGVCILELESGQTVTLSSGESYGDYIETRCGSSQEFPCFCNPNLKNQMECPYCGFVQVGGDLLCAKHQETISFNDGESDQTCTCQIPDDPNQEPIQTCVEGTIPPPTFAPPGNEENESDNDKEATGCTINDLDGNVVTIPHGDSFGDLVEGVCGDSNEWPAFCNTELEASLVSRSGSQSVDTIEYPYCVYSDTLSGEPACARDNEQVVYVDVSGEEVRCSCSYAPSDFGGEQSTCEPLDGNGPVNQPTMDPFTNADGADSITFYKSIVMGGAVLSSFLLLW
jgi:hypothetical protein